MGTFKVEIGKNILGIEGNNWWVTPGHWTESNFPCGEAGERCNQQISYVDPGYQFMNL